MPSIKNSVNEYNDSRNSDNESNYSEDLPQELIQEMMKDGISLNISRKYYSSDICGTYIVNAFDGSKYPWLVGSKDEEKLFRVIDSTCTIDSTGRYNPGTRVSHKLFYDSPEQYEIHRKIKLNKSIKENFRNKNRT